ncbi:hypothetical protein GY45DRAFT_1324815 [Cubamyces sp. BRFM 1775]|nr:hypothetical protein GY45DRAFT_1324815 [Cubamyces sp. BRFM 1775]
MSSRSGPVTRSRRNLEASSSKVKPDGEVNDDGVDGTKAHAALVTKNDPEYPNGTTLQSLLQRALGGAKELEREKATLRKQVEALQNKLDRVVETEDVQLRPQRGKRRSGATIAELTSEGNHLRKQVQRLEKLVEKQRKRIHELSIRELKNEAEDLVETAEFEVGDAAHKMRKLLRRFHDLMLENSLEEGEECLICMEVLQPRKCRSFPCQHTFCDECVGKLNPEPGEPELIRCPQCRAVSDREDAEVVQFTASEQWDALLDVAKQWAKMDVRRAESTSEEEDAEEFIDDGQETSTTASEPAPHNPLASSPEPATQGEQDTAPETPGRLRKRRAATTPTPEPGPSERGEQPEAGPSNTAVADQANPEDPGDTTQPTSPTSPTQRTPSYAQAPPRDKRKMLEQLAEARSKKRRV